MTRNVLLFPSYLRTTGGWLSIHFYSAHQRGSRVRRPNFPQNLWRKMIIYKTYLHMYRCRQSRNLTRKMIMAEKTALTLMGRAYDVIENSWLTLGEGSRMFLAGGKPASEVVRLMEDLLSKNNVTEHVLVVRSTKWDRHPLIGCSFLVPFSFSPEAHVKGNELLIDAGQEVSLFFRDMLELGNSIHNFLWHQQSYYITSYHVWL